MRKLCLATVPLLAAATAQAQAARTIALNVFPGGDNWPIWVAQDKGFFAANGITVTITNTPNSVAQITGLIDGKFDIAMTAFDNVVAYQEGQGEVALSSPPDLFAFMGGIAGTLRLLVQPDIHRYADLKDKTLGVDAANTGYALMMYKLLALHGLAPGDYRLERAGGTLNRVNLLMQGKFAGTMVTTPLDIVPVEKGYRVLGDVARDVGPYQRIVGAARRSWAERNSERLVAFIRGYAAGIDWLRQNVNRDEAVEIYLRHLPNATRAIAWKAYDAVRARGEGLQPHARFDPEGARTVLAVRSEFAAPKKNLDDPLRYADLRYYERAMR